MRKYEGLIVLKTQGEEKSVQEMISMIGKEIEAEGAKLDSVDDLGRRKFAYESNHRDGGQYVSFNFAAAPEAINAIKSRLRLVDVIHSQHYQRLD